MIRLKNVSKSFDGGQTFAVKDVSLEVRAGETLALLGSSGCGKTTTLKMVNRLVEPSDGVIEIGGDDVTMVDPVRLRRSIGYVFQGVGLFPHFTIEENVALPLRIQGIPKEKHTNRVHEMLEMVHLHPAEFAGRYPHELSGGQQQRAGVARALVSESEYLLMDEPFGALDAITRDTLQEELLSIKKQFSKTIIFVTHDLFEALTVADRIAVMHRGGIEQVAPPDEMLSNPATPFVKSLFEKPARQLETFWRRQQ